MPKQKLTLSLDAETIQKLREFAKEHHTTMSQAVTDWIWSWNTKSDNTTNKIQKEEK